MPSLFKTIFTLVLTESLFVTPLVILAEFHSTFYAVWVITSKHVSSYFSVTELVIAQQRLMENLFTSLPSTLTFMEKELLHLQDIVYLLIGLYVYLAALVTTLIVMFFWKKIRDFFITGRFRRLLTVLVWGSIAFILVGIRFAFEPIFLLLHENIFTNDYWLLPESALLINIYPPHFFEDMLFLALTLTVIFYIVTIAISYSLEKKYGNFN